jgi:hypothetical protein
VIKRSIQKEVLTIVNVCAPDSGITQYRNHILLNLNTSLGYVTIIVVGFNTPLYQWTHHPERKINKYQMETTP